MIRFKVVKASKLLLIFSVIILILAVGIIIFATSASEKDIFRTADLVQTTDTARTQMVFAVSDSDPAGDKLYLDPDAAYDEMDEIEIEIISTEKDVSKIDGELKVLIYHTHTHEAYEQVSSDPYVAVEAWRTTDTGHSVVRVGEELAKALRRYGFTVVHDTTDHEGSELSTAYTRSLETLISYEEEFDLYIDLHRDAYYEGLDRCLSSPGMEPKAQLMLLIGNGNGFDEKPFYAENHIFAKKLTQRINGICPGLCREVLVKDGRYNQHIGVFSVLIEVGHNLNTLAEALNAVAPLADGIYDLMIKNPDLQLEAIRNEQSAMHFN